MTSDSAQPWSGGTVLSNVPYSTDVDDPHRQLDLYIPTIRTPSHPPILLVYVHGGLWMDRDKSEYAHIGRHYTTAGLTVAVVNYRQTQHKPSPPPAAAHTHAEQAVVEVEEDMSTVIRHPTHTLDLAAALIFLTSDASVQHIPADAYDRRRVVVFGHSCGAHMLALLVTNPAAYNLPPPTLASLIGCIGSEGLYSVAHYAAAHPDWSADLYRVFASFDDPIDQSKLSVQRLPWLVLHSSGDQWVERWQAEVWQQWLVSGGGEVRLVDVTGGHFEVVERIGSDGDSVSPHVLPWIERLGR